ncbi:SDR family oxidoreductase [Streptococcus sp.]|uniref:SDR family NAD(P)-dependent oxidoreductase n=1 Tax=Streptococcus sp. TaxID=1306 RepID=UPI00258BC279|nr:SDR family oxidoreductase [Streptococcus sp.]
MYDYWCNFWDRIGNSKIFLTQGYRVVALSVDSLETVELALSQLKELGDVDFYNCDISDKSETSSVVQTVVKKYGSIDVLVNNTGIVGKTINFLDDAMLDDAKWVFDINVFGTLYLSQLVAHQMIKINKGVIINVGSLSGEIVNGVSVGYASSKSAVHMMTKVMARDLATYGIRVVTVAPGCVATDLLPDEFKEYVGNLSMKKRPINPEELAGVIYLMVQPEASAINGNTVFADDGYCSFKM